MSFGVPSGETWLGSFLDSCFTLFAVDFSVQRGDARMETNTAIPTQPPNTLASLVEKQGFQYHARLAPGVKFDDSTTEAVRDAVTRNMGRIESPVGGEFDIPLDKLF
jgi:hypothetical protein